MKYTKGKKDKKGLKIHNIYNINHNKLQKTAEI